MAGNGRRERRSVEFWHQLVEAQPESGRTVAEFCAARGVGQAGFYAWRKRLAGAAGPSGAQRRAAGSATPGFAAVRVTAEAGWPAASAATAIEVVLPGGTVLRAPAGCAPDWLARLAAALRSAGC